MILKIQTHNLEDQNQITQTTEQGDLENQDRDLKIKITYQLTGIIQRNRN